MEIKLARQEGTSVEESPHYQEIQTLKHDYALYLEEVESQSRNKSLGLPNVEKLSSQAAVAAVIAWFNANDYDMAAELLAHARSNKSTSSSYTPSNRNHLYGNKLVNALRAGKAKSGTGAFNKGGTTATDDLYYAIHAFNWKKVNSWIRITDRYDYAESGEYTGIGSAAVRAMYVAQKRGVITPYLVVVDG